MSRVNWRDYLPKGARVIISHLCIPNECTRMDRDVAAIALPRGYGIDIEWLHDQLQFAVTLFRTDIDNPVETKYMQNPEKVVQQVAEWANDYTAGTTAFNNRQVRKPTYENSTEFELMIA